MSEDGSYQSRSACRQPALREPGNLPAYGLLVLALASLSGGTLYQKRFVVGIDPLLSLLMQLLAAMIVMLPLAIAVDGFEFHASTIAIAGLAWAILVNSCIGLLLYLVLLARGASGRVASLFYLVPPTTAVLAALVLHARFDGHDALGFALAACGVWLRMSGMRMLFASHMETVSAMWTSAPLSLSTRNRA